MIKEKRYFGYVAHFFAVALAVPLLCAAQSSARERRHNFMETFTDREREQPHVKARSIELPHDFLSGTWGGMLAASDGKTYFSFGSHNETDNAQFYSYDPATDTLTHVIDMGIWFGQSPETIGEEKTVTMVHSQVYEADGRIYMASRGPRGLGALLAYELGTGECIKLAPSPDGPVPTMIYEPVYKRIYGITTGYNLFYYDLETGEISVVGDFRSRSYLVSDENGIVYGSTHGGMIVRYDPKYDMMSALHVLLPRDPEAPRIPAPNEQPPLWAYDRETGEMQRRSAGGNRHWDQWWTPLVRDERTGWWYGVTMSQEYLFRFRPPESRYHHRGLAEGLASMSFREPDRRIGNVSRGIAKKDRTIYYISYPVWQPQAHLTSYDIDTGAVTDHGPIVMEGGRRLSEMHGLEVGSDGRLHGTGMVWSIEGEDPANRNVQRGGCYFHCRLVIIDPDSDFQHPENARTW